MEKKTKTAISFMVLVIFFLFHVQGIQITGYQSYQKTGVSVYILPASPLLEIISPENTSYQEDEYILLDYSAILIDTVWYNLDNGPNITINSSFYFKTSPGSHIIYLYGNQSNGTILKDNVTFYVQPKTSQSGGGGGGKKEEITIPLNITLEKEVIPISLKQNEKKIMSLFVENNEKNTVNINIENMNLEGILANISEKSFSLNPGQKKEVLVDFNAPENKTPGIYIEKLIIKTDNSEKEVIFYVEVESKEALFDLSLEMPEDKIYSPGEEVSAEIIIYNLGKQGQTEINVEYLIRTPEGEIILGEKQTLLVGTSMTIQKKFTLPETIKKGHYIFYVKASYDSKVSSASKTFQVQEPEKAVFPKSEKIINELKRNQEYIAQAVAVLLSMIVLSSIIKSFLGSSLMKAFLLKRKSHAAVKALSKLKNTKKPMQKIKTKKKK